jgi:hypothetical protein
MELYVLKFAKIIILRHDIAEVVIDENIVINLAMINEYHNFLISHLTAPFSLLINKINDYSYEFQAQLVIGNLPQIHAIAVVTHKRKVEIITHLLTITTPRKIEWNISTFSQRSLALEWLENQQDKIMQQNPALSPADQSERIQ